MGKLYVVGIGPGDIENMTQKALTALEESDIIVGYTVYADLLKEKFSHKEFMTTPMKQEKIRCEAALSEASKGKTIAMVSSGDAGVYGMAGLIYELLSDYENVSVEVIPGITAALSGGAVLGAPLGHDFSVISLSDLLTPWELIEKRLRLSAEADMAICLYNPSSRKRSDYLEKACSIMMEHKPPETVCGLVRNIGRHGEAYKVLSLKELKDEKVDMFTTVFIGNKETVMIDNKMVTPRGYRL
ncbi:precorrin-3B C(17)-methyltransferase [Anaeropeptidivorans aminofermentans]|jgi:precorrin-3B C17-methyltransferase|uniref:precorrin-3B C(17)-methyltransferase n=1 Tax=Anaeropeptidivorans aminofermentans TaxID=2934315 RepID=UPI002024B39C|nr:precorrin-3B C(17)-methyltransferase [Anaeropeptidivorans aminofermentans]